LKTPFKSHFTRFERFHPLKGLTVKILPLSQAVEAEMAYFRGVSLSAFDSYLVNKDLFAVEFRYGKQRVYGILYEIFLGDCRIHLVHKRVSPIFTMLMGATFDGGFHANGTKMYSLLANAVTTRTSPCIAALMDGPLETLP